MNGSPTIAPDWIAEFRTRTPRLAEVPLADLVVDAGTQARVRTDPELVSAYRQEMAGSAAFPALDVFDAGGRLLLVDGFHRLEAARQLGRATLPARIFSGEEREAILYALGANAQNDTSGARRTNADKRYAVVRATELMPDASHSEIARLVVVSHTYVRNVRRELAAAKRASAGPADRSESAPVSVGLASEGPDEDDEGLDRFPGIGVPPVLRPPAPKPEIVTLVGDRETDEEFLAGLPALKLLTGEPARRFRLAALDYRFERDLPELEAYSRKIAPRLGRGKIGEMSAHMYKVACFLRIVHPREWKRCAECLGTGREAKQGVETARNCTRCHGDGFHVGFGR
jgi:hypothetical protein